jgi:fumarate hydratase class II
LSELAGTLFTPHPVKVESMAAHDALAALSSALKNVAFTLMHIANDIRHLASGPRAGLCELFLPEDGLSSSIMPGKRNATMAEAIVQIGQRVAGNDATVELANASSLFELNVSKPVMITAILESVQLLVFGIPRFSTFIGGITPNRDRMASNIERSLMLATALTPELGYDRVSELTRQAEKNGLAIREAVVQAGLLSEERFNELVDLVLLAGVAPENRS